MSTEHQFSQSAGPGRTVRRYDGRSAQKFTTAVAGLIYRNLAEGDDRARLVGGFARPVGIYEPVSGESCTVKFDKAGATVYNGIAGRPSVILGFERAGLRKLPALEVRWWTTPSSILLGRYGRMLLGGVLTRKTFRAHRALLHPLVAARFLAMLAPPVPYTALDDAATPTEQAA
ncbi:hypothetical protein HWD35_24520 [Tsukamurella tyrosinosolvens]|uniref:hypothetical protein n=1 Tax=Tsukamurella tyrosinosolvens TaxID=57704 RepID=UPI001CE0D7C9|nr:hypothetical protein [Tsukamurella tyrosinosolvens]MCA4997887.1 hypothetical protein [Tsukamurella tyrosinosolvens]